MSSESAISVAGLGKSYQIDREARATTLGELLSRRRGAAARREFWALEDVSFEVGRGEALGVIGRNGAGKSTLLKVLSRITRPSKGEVRLNGRVGSLLEVGTGFHPELTGRENIWLNGAILGMRRHEIAAKFDDIVEFAETSAFLDVPVKRYSSGMYVRLAFAVAAHLNPDILIVDEVLAVGDAAFQKKCLGKMGDVTRMEGRTVLLVSHNLVAVTTLCTRAILLDGGHLIGSGPATQVAQQYLESLGTVSASDLATRTDRTGSGAVRFTRLTVHNAAGSSVVQTGDEVTIDLAYESTGGMKDVHFSLGIHGPLDEPLFHLGTNTSGDDIDRLPTTGVVSCRIPQLPVMPGAYLITAFCTVGGLVADWVIHAGALEVEGGDFFDSGRLPPEGNGSVLVKHSWSVRDGSPAP